ncbi:MAG TPA: hypothetical protein VGJ26_17445, partial [Pirellulales bacterium]
NLFADKGRYPEGEPHYRKILIGHPNEQRKLGDPMSLQDALEFGQIMPIPEPALSAADESHEEK